MSGDSHELHVWWDYNARAVFVYAERRADRERLTRWLGPPAKVGRDGAVAHWRAPLDALVLRKRRSASPAQRAAGTAALAKARAARGTARSASGPEAPPARDAKGEAHS